VVQYQKSDLPFPAVARRGDIVVRAGSFPSPADLYASGDCAIQPSRLEGLGYMVLEPLICGIPTITANVPPMNEWTAGTLLCESRPSAEPSLPRQRGCGSAPLYDVDENSLTTAIEELEASDLSRLSKQALEFRCELAPETVKAQWHAALQQL
jgi:glycosyltransferase involved in cell wall biosynthesis